MKIVAYIDAAALWVAAYPKTAMACLFLGALAIVLVF